MIIREWYISTGTLERGNEWSRNGWCVSYDVDDEWWLWALDQNFSRRRDAEHALIYLRDNKITAADYHAMTASEQKAVDRAVCENCIAW